jgi:predicted nuclease of predicted toxin-antitoxin system
VKFLIDNQLPESLAKYLCTKGHDALHVLNVGLASAKDGEICKYAAEHALVMVTKDEDFSRQAILPGAAIQVVWVRLGNCRKSALLAAFESPSLHHSRAGGRGPTRRNSLEIQRKNSQDGPRQPQRGWSDAVFFPT